MSARRIISSNNCIIRRKGLRSRLSHPICFPTGIRKKPYIAYSPSTLVMFIGHYALAMAAKRIDRRPSLGIFFLATQWIDLIWPFFVLFGLERVNIDPGNTAFTPLDFEYYPWSHSLLMVLVWAGLFALGYFALTRNRRGALLLAALVFSHWVLDWMTHAPDLPLAPYSDIKTGLGLWNYKWPVIILETALLAAGVYIYTRVTKAKNATGKWAFRGLVTFLVLIHFMNALGDPPPSSGIVAWVGLSQWLIVAWGYWIDKNRM